MRHPDLDLFSLEPRLGLDETDLVASPAAAPADEIDPARILRDRPDVFAAFYSEFYGPDNDRHSHAWIDRVGGETPEDFARYWYDAYGRAEGYTPGGRSLGAPAEGSVDLPQGRATADGILLSKILSDRPDVFQAFFTEYYGPNNDRHSDAWVQRVGGDTVEDFAKYWYNAYGRLEGYVPSGSGAAGASLDPEAVGPAADGDVAPLPGEDPSLDPWNHPAIYPDWAPPYAGWQPPDAVTPPDVSPDPVDVLPIVDDHAFARPLVVHHTEDGIELVPATLDEIATLRTLFEDAAF